jgi:uncharacterized protein (DUF2147 family)
MRAFSRLRLLTNSLIISVALFTPQVYSQKAAGATATALATSSAGPFGSWMTSSGGAVVQIAPCGPGLCGQIVGIELGPNDPMPNDWAGATQCRLTIIRVVPAADGSSNVVWKGTIINPSDGRSYHARITLAPTHQLRLLGYVGLPLFGRTQIWTPYKGPMASDCRLPIANG